MLPDHRHLTLSSAPVRPASPGGGPATTTIGRFMGILFRKTPKGSSEIETRAHRLPPRMRSTLILVDGRRSSDELRGLIGASCDETLQALREQGFIEVAGAAEPAAPAAPAASRTADAATATPAPVRSAVDLTAIRRDAVRHLTDQVGPMAEALALRMERCKDLAELLPLIGTAAQVIANVRGAAAANAYRARFPAA
jgi:hypothetical protein